MFARGSRPAFELPVCEELLPRMDLSKVRVNALALRNLSSLPFKQLRASGGAVPPVLAARARWLEHGLGAAQALATAATAALSQSVPSALVAPVRRHPSSRKDASTPAIWIFGTHSVIAQACELLGAAFAETQHGVWSPKSPKQITDALFDAVSSAIVAALEADGAIRVGPDIVHHMSQLSYRFKLVLSSGLTPTVVLRVEVFQTDLRFVDDDDTAAVLSKDKETNNTPIQVVTSPLALRGTLSKRRLAGDSLSASVLDRWREAGLLPARPLKDSGVIFLDLGSGLQIPFPRACVLTSAKKQKSKAGRNDKSSDRSRGRSSSSPRTREALFRSRKRPRSPSVVVDEREEQRLASSSGPVAKPVKSESKLKTQTPNAVLEAAAKVPALTAAAFNAALIEAGRNGFKDPTPVFQHPLARTPAPPPPLESLSKVVNSEQKDSIEEAIPQNLDVGAANQTQTRIGIGPLPSPVDLSARGFVSSRSMNQSSDLDMFGLSAGFGGVNMDMGDVGSLDDDVTQFFGVDSGFLGGFDSISPAVEVSSNRNNGISLADSVSGQAKTKSSTPRHVAGASAGKSSAENLTAPSRRSLGVHEKAIDKSNEKKKSNLSPRTAAEVVHKVLTSFAAVSSPTSRPSEEERNKALQSFFEEDLTKRKTDSLTLGLKPSERFSRSMVCSVDAPFMPSYTRYGSVQGIMDIMSGKKTKHCSRKPLREIYVPSRRLELYSSMARKTSNVAEISRVVSSLTGNLEVSSDEESDSETQNDNVISSLSDRAENISELEVKDGFDSLGAFDATKVAQTVAVDCASACLVLIEDYQRSSTIPTLSSSRPASFSGPTTSTHSTSAPASNSSHVGGGLEAKSPALTSVSNLGPLGPSPKIPNPPSNFARSYHTSSAHSTSQRVSQKRDRDANALLALLQMQCITIEGLQLFDSLDVEETSNNSADNADSKTLKSSSNSGQLSFKTFDMKPASTASLRRVLHGFPRTIECSKALRRYALSPDSPNCSGNLKVDGPLCLTDVYGDGTDVITLSTPQVCVGFNNDWVETSGNILPLWEKSGLEPYSEQKHVQYTILAPKSFEEDAKVFFRDVSAAYEECSFGRHTPIASDPFTPIASTSSKSKNIPKSSDLTSEESALVYHFSIAVAGWCNKLTSLSQEMKKSNSDNLSNNVVVYVVSPFRRGANSANAALLRAVAPLLSCIPGIAGSFTSLSAMPVSLPSTPWRSPNSSNTGLSLHVRVVPHEAIARRLSYWMKSDLQSGIPLRPQLVKAVAFSVYSSLRWKRLRSHSFGTDKEAAGIVLGSALSPDDQMSPMTPDFVTDPNSLSIAPHSPLAVTLAATGVDEAVHSSLLTPMQGGLAIDQSSALSPSFLHEPAVVLAGVGSQMSDPSGSNAMVLHLAYAYCKRACRYVFTWTDNRGEMLDMASVPVLENGANGTRRRAFWHMWHRGQRWRLPYVDSVHITISKLEDMNDGEVDDWEQVFAKILYGSVSSKSESNDRTRIVRRFPSIRTLKTLDSDVYIDHPTPATPSASQAHPSSSGTPVGPARSEPALDIQANCVRSLTLLTVRDQARERLLVDVLEQNDMKELLVVPESSICDDRSSRAKALLVGMEENGVAVTEVDMLVHYGDSNRASIEKNSASIWDAEKSSDIVKTVAENFHNLRYVGTPPCWPQTRWRNKLPLHMELVRNYRNLLGRALTSQITRCNTK